MRIGATGRDFSSSSMFGIIFLLSILSGSESKTGAMIITAITFITFALNHVKEFIDFTCEIGMIRKIIDDYRVEMPILRRSI